MERIVKERLVGAAVLMAAAIILIPEMLSGPDRRSQAPATAAQTRNDAPIKTYTIDLSQSAKPAAATVVDERTPPPEEPAPEPTAEAQPAPVAQAKPEDRQPQAPASSPAPTQPVVEQPTAAAPPPQRALASTPSAPTSARWAVQVGTFSKEANAERLAKQLRDQGQAAFVMPVKSGSSTLYRVRIGPMKDRASAEAALREAKSPGAKIVAHP